MDRRDFNKGFAALLGAGSLPLPLAANSAARAATTAMPWHAYLFADLIARSRGTVSAEFLARSLRVSHDDAASLMSDLTRNGIINAANSTGLARAVHPIPVCTLPVSDSVKVAANSNASLRDWSRSLKHQALEDPEDNQRNRTASSPETTPDENPI